SNIVADRRSQENVNSTTPEYAIFLNDPVDICETAESGEIEVLGITRCGIDDFCIKFIGTRSGQIDLLLDFDGNDQVFTPGTADVMITGSVSAGDVGQAVCLDWNGLDGLGNALPEDANTPIPISLSFAQGIYHFPIYDAELMTDGFDINTVRPAGPKPLLYYDDTEISVSSGSGEPNVQLMGCNLPCHSWTNYSNPGTVGFGNLNTINSWWFSQQTMNTMTFFLPGVFTCDIEGPQVACEDEEVDLGIIIDLTPDNAMSLTIESINWTGPGILGGNGTEVITINEDGSYNADLSFINELGDTCTSSCQFEYAQLPKSEETIDTLLAFGDSLVVNTEIYDVDGTYTQILTAANGCDSILTIIVEVEMPEIELRCEIFGPEFLCAGDTTTLTLDIIKDPIDAPDPEILSIGWFGPGVPIGASGQSVVAEQAGVYIAEYIWVNFTNDTLKGACEYTLEVMPEFEVTIDTLINSGDVVIFNGESFDSAGIFTQELSTTMGCDSIIIITIDVIDPTYTCLLTGTPEICEGEVSIIELEAVVDPIGAPAPIISEIVWSGPGVAANTTGTTIDATESGIYTAELSWFNNADSILSTSCIYSLTVNPTFETTIDTLIGEDEIIAISGQIITSPGQYILNFNAQNGCDSLLIINVIQESSVVYYDLDDCRSTDYSRFDPDYPSPVDCAFMTASNVFRVNPNVNSHSCTPGVNGGVGLCVSSEDDCDYNPDSEKAIIFELVVSPDEEEAVQITSLRFFERAPETFQWIVGTTGLNNYPTQYGLRVLKNNQEIFSSADNVTTTDWTAETFNFATLPDFKVQEQTIFRFELLGYCLIGNDSDVTAWDIDEISIQADCAEFVSNTIDIVGQVKTISNEPLENVQVDLKFGEFDFQKFVDQTNEAGQYAFQDVPRFQDYMVKPVSGDDYLRGVSTLDLIHIQRHILGLDRFEYAHQMIAADVNKSKSITAIDILQLRKLILGIYDRLPDNRSWRFMKSNQELHVSNPWAIQENVEFNNTEKDKSQGFVGIKIGDVNNDISLLPSSNVDSRSAKNSIDLMIESNDLRVGELSTVAIKIANENDIVGIQMSMALKGIDIINVESNFGLTDSHYKITPEHFVLSYTDVTGSQMNDEATIFLDVIPNVAINISDALELDKEILLPEIYKGNNLTVHPINLIFDANDVDNFVGTNYPNPFVHNTTIEVMASGNEEGVIKLYDFNGRMLMNRNIDLIKG
ncbi:MAG: hypothetical protein KJN84_12610, partial [Bacteroidia bacterium]|nr:hypothetical protein [Bacteroidia bacterium]